MQSRVRSYVGYAIKSGNIRFGVENIIKSRSVFVCLFDASLSQNSKDKLFAYTDARNVKRYCVTIEEFYPDKNCKAIAITDSNLGRAIINEMEENGNDE